MAYSLVIGLEVHAQLSTRTKLFCGCELSFGEDPNMHTCPVCLGMPGTLPMPNAQAVEYAIRLGLALDCTIDHSALFTRKNYFYPDLPKGYQITQTGGMPLYDRPICANGKLHIVGEGVDKTISIVRIHMEEDAGKLLHDRGGDSLFDANRCGTPLCEIVTGPDMRSIPEAILYLQRLKQIVEYMGVCDGNMEEGNFRCDANVSLRKGDDAPLGNRVELKNMNSFSNIEKAIQHEIIRQAEILDNGGTVVQETRAYDVAKGTTRSLRSKEDAHDYRYFPEPDLVPLHVTTEQIERIRGEMPELPEARVRRYVDVLGLPEYDARVITADKTLADWYEGILAKGAAAKQASNWFMGDVLRTLKETGKNIADLPITPGHIASLIERIEDKTISGKIAKDIFLDMAESGKTPDQLIEEKGLRQITDDGPILAAIEQVLAANPKELADYRAGKEKLFGFFVGQSMRATGGKANPGTLNELLKKALAG
jgi:aspartyl-tRNA(Asn)/glutamyl-tRNA(Gln) amidotransferase subunit B